MADFFQSKTLKWIILAIGALVVLVFVFCIGVFVGTERADFSFEWADQYHRNFAGPQGGFFGDFMGMDRQFTNANGIFGQIIAINNDVLTVKDNDGDNTEKNILANNKTTIILQKKNIKLSDLKIDDNIVVIGEPDNTGEIQAKLIRVMPALPNKNVPGSTLPGLNPATNSNLNTQPQNPQQNNNINQSQNSQ